LVESAILQLTHRHAQWLMARQKVLSENIAHASSPGYRAIDVEPFEKLVAAGGLDLRATSPRHLRIAQDGTQAIGTRVQRAFETSHSGNTVSLDRQLVTANEVRQAYMLNSSIVKSLNRLLSSAIKG